jgi:hypothetical protein
MIDITIEKPITLARLAASIVHRGTPISATTMWRYTRKGLNGVILETTKVGSCTCSTVEAWARFNAALNDPSRQKPYKPRTAKQRAKSDKAASKRLAKRGA